MVNISGNFKLEEVNHIMIENLSRLSILYNLVCWCIDQWSFQAELLTFFGDEDIDFHHSFF